MTNTGGWCWWSGCLPGSLWAPERARQCTTVFHKRSTLLCLESMLESEQDETLPEALRTQALTALTHNLVLCLCKQLMQSMCRIQCSHTNTITYIAV